jgi:polysaccharide biosynthesis transport protein
MDTDTARLQALASSSPAPPMMSAPMGGLAAGPGPAQMQLAQIDAAIASASRTLGANHPDYISLLRQRDIAASAAAQERSAAAANARSSASVSSGPSVGAMFNAQREKVLAQRGKLAEAKQLQNDVAVLRAQLNETQIKGAKEEQEAQSVDAGLTLLGSATPPDQATFPRTIPVMLGAVALGLGLGILLALLFELLNRRVRGPDDIAIDGVPLIGVIQGRVEASAPRRLGRILRLSGPKPAAAE